MGTRRTTWWQRLLRNESSTEDGDISGRGDDNNSGSPASSSGNTSGWHRLKRAMSRGSDPRTPASTDGRQPSIPEEGEEDEPEKQVGNNAWLFAAEKEAPCCLSCGKRFSVMVTRYNCRACLMAVCTDCSSQRLKLFPNVRVCPRCYEVNSNRSKFEMVPRPAPFVLKQGRLTKMGQMVHTWRARTWILDSNGLLSYFGSDLKRPKGTVNTCRLVRWIDGVAPELDAVSWPQNTDREKAFALEFERKTVHIIADSREDVHAWRRLISMFARQCLHCGESLFSSSPPNDDDDDEGGRGRRDGDGDDDGDDESIGVEDNDDDEEDVAPINDDDDDDDDYDDGVDDGGDDGDGGEEEGTREDAEVADGDATTTQAPPASDETQQQQQEQQQQQQQQQQIGEGDAESDTVQTKTDVADANGDDAANTAADDGDDDLSGSRSSCTSSTPRDRSNTIRLFRDVNGSDIVFMLGTGTAFHLKCLRCTVCKQRLDPTLDPTKAFNEGARAAFNAEGYVHCRQHAEMQARAEAAAEAKTNTLKGIKLDVTILPAAVHVCNQHQYEELRDAEIRHQAALAAEQKLAREEKLATKAAAKAAQQQDDHHQPEPHPHAPVTPQIVMCTMLGIMESLTAVQDMIATETFAQAGEKFRRKTTLPNGAAYEMIDHAPKQFERLRNALGISIEEYKRSFESIPDVRKQISGGRSGCMVLPTKDKRFIIKMIPRVERDNLLVILDEYIQHLQDFPNSLLVKFTGLYDLRIKGSKNFQSLVIMQNVLHTDVDVQEIYDLKGSYVGRNAITMKHKGDVHNYSGVRKDMDLRRNLVVGGRAKMYIDFQLSQDTSFLNKFNLMDYSLLVGIHNCTPGGECCKQRRQHEISKERGKLTHDDISKWGVRGAGLNQDDPSSESVYFFGIIDVLQAWTAKKRAEKFVKNLAGHDKHGISAVDADEYAQRFCEFVLSHLKEE